MAWARLGLYAASRCWGGAGFVLVPHQAGVVATELLQMVAAYDPEFVVTLEPTADQLQRLRPGVPPSTAADAAGAEAASRVGVEQQTRLREDDRRARASVSAACSSYRFAYEPGDRQEQTVVLSGEGTGARLTPIEEIPTIAAGHLRQGASWDGAAGVISAARYGLMSDPTATSTTAPELNSRPGRKPKVIQPSPKVGRSNAASRVWDRAGAPGSVRWWAKVLFLVGLALGFAGPIAGLVGLAPVTALGHSAIRGVGLVLAVAGVVVTLAAQVAMGASWRIGVDPAESAPIW